MITSAIINRVFATIDSKKSIVWTPCENSTFENFIRQAASPCSILDFDNTYFGFNNIDLIVCNNRISYLEKCIDLAYFLHCSVLIVDHDLKPPIISNNIEHEFNISPVYQIALNEDIHKSWSRIHNIVLDYNINNPSNIESWRNLIFQLTISNFTILDLDELHEKENNQN